MEEIKLKDAESADIQSFTAVVQQYEYRPIINTWYIPETKKTSNYRLRFTGRRKFGISKH